MFGLETIYYIFILLIIIQSIAGVGVLVIGTPALLLMNYEMIEILSILLPISITTSLLNLLVFKFYLKQKNMRLDNKYLFSFFVYCIPSIFFGMIILSYFEHLIKFEYIVAAVIIFSVIVTNLKKFLKKSGKSFKMVYLLITGTVHGVTNSGGSLLSLLISSEQDKNNSRFNISFFYFFLASFQYLIFLNIFDKNFSQFNYIVIFVFLIFGVVIGNIISKFVKEKNFRILINLLSLITCFFLITKS